MKIVALFFILWFVVAAVTILFMAFSEGPIAFAMVLILVAGYLCRMVTEDE